jgi:hypothetical protein
LTKFFPKHKLFASTIINQGRTYLAITIDSVGYVATYKTMFALLGIEESETTKEYHCQLDRRRMLGKKRTTTTRYKQKRNELKNKKISEGKTKLAKDRVKGLTYETGMAGPGGSLGEMAQPGGSVKDSNRPKKKAKSRCETCRLVGHSTRRARACKYSINKTSVFYGNLSPTAGIATVAMVEESENRRKESKDCENYGEKQDGEYVCPNQSFCVVTKLAMQSLYVKYEVC